MGRSQPRAIFAHDIPVSLYLIKTARVLHTRNHSTSAYLWWRIYAYSQLLYDHFYLSYRLRPDVDITGYARNDVIRDVDIACTNHRAVLASKSRALHVTWLRIGQLRTICAHISNTETSNMAAWVHTCA